MGKGDCRFPLGGSAQGCRLREAGPKGGGSSLDTLSMMDHKTGNSSRCVDIEEVMLKKSKGRRGRRRHQITLPYKMTRGRLRTQRLGYRYADEPGSLPTSSDAEAAGASKIGWGFLDFIAMVRGSSVIRCTSHHRCLGQCCKHRLCSVIIDDTGARRTSDVTMLSDAD
ncbi:hypothetical protein HPB51_007445 [Rhipicephalus microplus]|uniref:Uncharacterized protein n=1 Tax=Rhipicephalus microplus TaxID=6941 RepID=A0A9J6EZ81_RHIMP|nr:hypothetical protein HPB51_007445 [Rhipicephalus microplus]